MTQHLSPGSCCLILDVPQYLTIMGKEDTGSEGFGLSPDVWIESRLTPSGCPTILTSRLFMLVVRKRAGRFQVGGTGGGGGSGPGPLP